MKMILRIGLISAIALSARADFVVVPGDRATQSGNTFTFEGFRVPGTFQTVYTAQNFSGPVLVNGIAFRMEEERGGLSVEAVIPRIIIQISTYSGTAASFNPFSYDANKGSDEMIAYDAAVHWTTTDLSGTGPNPLDLKLLFSRPFYYDPAQGSMLINYTSSGPFTSGMAVDAHSHGNPNIGWIGSGNGNLVTQFDVTPVPEPACAILVFFGLFGLYATQKRS